ncbi:hypothetical protein GCM10007877_31080 [Marinibactrum halimedae]|uniref:Uncharacterized protein n=1 Tax=Marinibactrum halimedae TaxID=1444977 RepID=A0AA37T659_9GAMM|nr:hypothetical protein GCM10007877_31080 [Marinibactrum halimedae]
MANNLPTESQVDGLLKLCSMGKVVSIEGAAKGKISMWKKMVEGQGKGSLSDLGGLLAVIPPGKLSPEIQSNYNHCIMEAMKVFVGGDTVESVSNTQTANQSQQVQIVLQQVVSDLPPEKQAFAEGVVESIGEVLEAQGESEITKAAKAFRTRMAEAKLLSYDIHTSPFPLPTKKAVMLCNGEHSISFTRSLSNGSQQFLLNGRNIAGIPGSVWTKGIGKKRLQLRYMEFLKEESTPILSFICGTGNG